MYNLLIDLVYNPSPSPDDLFKLILSKKSIFSTDREFFDQLLKKFAGFLIKILLSVFCRTLQGADCYRNLTKRANAIPSCVPPRF